MVEDAAVAAAARSRASLDHVREARQRGQRYLVELAAMVLGRYNRADEPAHRAARERLLAPLWKQTQAARAARSPRRKHGRAWPELGAESEQPANEQSGRPGAELGMRS